MTVHDRSSWVLTAKKKLKKAHKKGPYKKYKKGPLNLIYNTPEHNLNRRTKKERRKIKHNLTNKQIQHTRDTKKGGKKGKE